MQTFIFGAMNKASRDKDLSKIKCYGPLASALGYIIHIANHNKNRKLNKQFTTYRGIQMKQDDIQKKYKINDIINLLGFTSSTLDKNTALSFAIGSTDLK